MGLARDDTSLTKKGNTICGTLNYMSPQQVKEEYYTNKTDVWYKKKKLSSYIQYQKISINLFSL
jgi:serine/threonine protein kinase